jgi:hypothetical protein
MMITMMIYSEIATNTNPAKVVTRPAISSGYDNERKNTE